MVTINGVKAQNLQTQANSSKKPTMNEILSKMQANFEQQTYLEQKNMTTVTQNQSTPDTQSCQTEQKFGFENLSSILQGENGILFNILPMLLSKDSKNMGQEILTRLLQNSGNPTLSKLVSMLTKVNKKNSVSQTSTQQTELQTHKIGEYKKISD